MDKYELENIIEEGDFYVTYKGNIKATGYSVAIKRYEGSDVSINSRKIAFREIRLMRKLCHENVPRMLEAFRLKDNFFLVFEYFPLTLLDKLNNNTKIHINMVRGYTLQITRALMFLHCHDIVHRDLKPENILVSEHDIIKLNNFDSATYIVPHQCPFTQYVSSRWYRAPELLLGYDQYDSSIDIWALGCIVMEMENDEPLFAGETDIDQLSLIIRYCGLLTNEQKDLLGHCLTGKEKRSVIKIFFDPAQFYTLVYILGCKYPLCDRRAISFANNCLRMNPSERSSAENLMGHIYLNEDNFAETYLNDMQKKVMNELKINTTLKDFVRRHKVPEYLLSGINYLTRPCKKASDEQLLEGEAEEEEEMICEREIMTEEEVMTEEGMMPLGEMMSEEQLMLEEEITVEAELPEETIETTEEQEEESETDYSEEESTLSSSFTLSTDVIENFYYQLADDSMDQKFKETSFQLLKSKPMTPDDDKSNDFCKDKIEIRFKKVMLPPLRSIRQVGLTLKENELGIEGCLRNLLRRGQDDDGMIDFQNRCKQQEVQKLPSVSKEKDIFVSCPKSSTRETQMEEYIRKELSAASEMKYSGRRNVRKSKGLELLQKEKSIEIKAPEKKSDIQWGTDSEDYSEYHETENQDHAANNCKQ